MCMTYHSFFFSVLGPETKTRFAPTLVLWLFQQTFLQMCPERLGHTRKQMMRKTALIKLPVIMPSTDHVIGTGRHFPSSFFLTILEKQRRSVFILLVVVLVRIHAPADGVCHLGPCRAVCILPGRVKRMHRTCEWTFAERSEKERVETRPFQNSRTCTTWGFSKWRLRMGTHLMCSRYLALSGRVLTTCDTHEQTHTHIHKHAHKQTYNKII
jgi:hypothetical protein